MLEHVLDWLVALGALVGGGGTAWQEWRRHREQRAYAIALDAFRHDGRTMVGYATFTPPSRGNHYRLKVTSLEPRSGLIAPHGRLAQAFVSSGGLTIDEAVAMKAPAVVVDFAPTTTVDGDLPLVARFLVRGEQPLAALRIRLEVIDAGRGRRLHRRSDILARPLEG